MKELDKNKVYDLSELTSEELNQVYKNTFIPTRTYRFLTTDSLGYSFKDSLNTDERTTNAKELFYTLENVQVDCRELSEEQIMEMVNVYLSNEYKYHIEDKTESLRLDDIAGFYYLQPTYRNTILVDCIDAERDIITYEKFMELFGNKEEAKGLTNDLAFIDYIENTNLEIAEESFKEITNSIADLLIYKNEKYGNSALNPLDIFNGKSKVGQRIDDKLARVKNSKELRKNDIADLLGYLTLVCQENNWTNFDEFKD